MRTIAPSSRALCTLTSAWLAVSAAALAAPSITKCATWMFLGASSRARLCASPRSANLPIANGAEPA
jgi:hypothetical protein